MGVGDIGKLAMMLLDRVNRAQLAKVKDDDRAVSVGRAKH